MSKWHVRIALVLIFNTLVIVGYILASIYVMNYFDTKLSVERGYSVIFGDLFHIEIVHPIISDGQIIYPPTAAGSGIWNYPFILFWVFAIGNLLLIAEALVYGKHTNNS
jgi:hypothetical protein